MSKRSNVMIVHPELMFFDKNGYAIIAANSKLLYRDDDHLSGYGADFVAPVFDNVFQNISDQAVR